MKICFVGPSNSAHLVKWCNWFTERGHEISVISFAGGNIKNVEVYDLNLNVDLNGKDSKKLKYLLSGKKIKRIVETINPDIVSVHYASSYGIAVALSGIKKYTLSVWGSDVFEFPQKSVFHKLLIKYSLKRSAVIMSTSKAMAEETSRYTSKKIIITPFGVDINLFNCNKRHRNSDDKFVVGNIKALSDKYGIKDLLKAVSIVMKQTNIPIELRIAGKGPQEKEYYELAEKLEISNITKWLGFISQEEAAVEWANMDIAIIPSEEESFGVSAVEAQACGTAVVVSDAPGLMEATSPGESSIVIRKNHPEEIAETIIELYYDKAKRSNLAQNGIKFVHGKFEINNCFEKILDIFNELIEYNGND